MKRMEMVTSDQDADADLMVALAIVKELTVQESIWVCNNLDRGFELGVSFEVKLRCLTEVCILEQIVTYLTWGGGVNPLPGSIQGPIFIARITDFLG